MIILNGIRQGSASILEGDADAGDVLDGKTFYKDDPEELLEGSLALTGDALVTDVKTGKKFYKDDPKTQLTGTFAGVDSADANAVAANILIDKTAYVNNVKITGTMPNYRVEVALGLTVPDMPIVQESTT